MRAGTLLGSPERAALGGPAVFPTASVDQVRPQDTVIWHAFPLGFTGAEAENPGDAPVAHRLEHVEGWLDHLVALGANALQLGPVFDSETHGYDTRDHLRVDPRLGDEADLRHLVEQAHARGVHVVLDGVFHHVGRSHPRFRAALAGDAGSAAWFRRDPARDDGWAVFEGHHQLVALDHGHPAVLEHVVEVVRHWLDAGVDGWRMDAAYAVPTSFWRAVSDAVRESHPHAWLLGEVIHGDYAAFVEESGFDSVTQYRLWKAVWSSLNDANLFELEWELRHHGELLQRFLPTTFLGNHDTTRIASQLHDERHLAHALAVLFTVGGVPAVYAGDDHAFRGVKEERAGGDDAVRPAFPASPAELSPLGAPVFALHQQLIGLRRRHPWLARARVEVERLENPVLVYRASDPEDGARGVTVALNLGDEALDVAVRPGERLLVGGTGPHEAAVFGAE